MASSRITATILGSIILLALVLQQTQGMHVDSLKKITRRYRQVCQSKHQISDAVANDAKKGIFADTKEFKCYVSCLLEFMKITHNGELDYEKSVHQIDAILPDDWKLAFRGGLDACERAAQGVNDHCEAAAIMLQCFYKNNIMYMFP